MTDTSGGLPPRHPLYDQRESTSKRNASSSGLKSKDIKRTTGLVSHAKEQGKVPVVQQDPGHPRASDVELLQGAAVLVTLSTGNSGELQRVASIVARDQQHQQSSEEWRQSSPGGRAGGPTEQLQSEEELRAGLRPPHAEQLPKRNQGKGAGGSDKDTRWTEGLLLSAPPLSSSLVTPFAAVAALGPAEIPLESDAEDVPSFEVESASLQQGLKSEYPQEQLGHKTGLRSSSESLEALADVALASVKRRRSLAGGQKEMEGAAILASGMLPTGASPLVTGPGVRCGPPQVSPDEHQVKRHRMGSISVSLDDLLLDPKGMTSMEVDWMGLLQHSQDPPRQPLLGSGSLGSLMGQESVSMGCSEVCLEEGKGEVVQHQEPDSNRKRGGRKEVEGVGRLLPSADGQAERVTSRLCLRDPPVISPSPALPPPHGCVLPRDFQLSKRPLTSTSEGLPSGKHVVSPFCIVSNPQVPQKLANEGQGRACVGSSGPPLRGTTHSRNLMDKPPEGEEMKGRKKEERPRGPRAKEKGLKPQELPEEPSLDEVQTPQLSPVCQGPLKSPRSRQRAPPYSKSEASLRASMDRTLGLLSPPSSLMTRQPSLVDFLGRRSSSLERALKPSPGQENTLGQADAIMQVVREARAMLSSLGSVPGSGASPRPSGLLDASMKAPRSPGMPPRCLPETPRTPRSAKGGPQGMTSPKASPTPLAAKSVPSGGRLSTSALCSPRKGASSLEKGSEKGGRAKNPIGEIATLLQQAQEAIHESNIVKQIAMTHLDPVMYPTGSSGTSWMTTAALGRPPGTTTGTGHSPLFGSFSPLLQQSPLGGGGVGDISTLATPPPVELPPCVPQAGFGGPPHELGATGKTGLDVSRSRLSSFELPSMASMLRSASFALGADHFNILGEGGRPGEGEQEAQETQEVYNITHPQLPISKLVMDQTFSGQQEGKHLDGPDTGPCRGDGSTGGGHLSGEVGHSEGNGGLFMGLHDRAASWLPLHLSHEADSPDLLDVEGLDVDQLQQLDVLEGVAMDRLTSDFLSEERVNRGAAAEGPAPATSASTGATGNTDIGLGPSWRYKLPQTLGAKGDDSGLLWGPQGVGGPAWGSQTGIDQPLEGNIGVSSQGHQTPQSWPPNALMQVEAAADLGQVAGLPLFRPCAMSNEPAGPSSSIYAFSPVAVSLEISLSPSGRPPTPPGVLGASPRTGPQSPHTPCRPSMIAHYQGAPDRSDVTLVPQTGAMLPPLVEPICPSPVTASGPCDPHSSKSTFMHSNSDHTFSQGLAPIATLPVMSTSFNSDGQPVCSTMHPGLGQTCGQDGSNGAPRTFHAAISSSPRTPRPASVPELPGHISSPFQAASQTRMLPYLEKGTGLKSMVTGVLEVMTRMQSPTEDRLAVMHTLRMMDDYARDVMFSCMCDACVHDSEVEVRTLLTEMIGASKLDVRKTHLKQREVDERMRVLGLSGLQLPSLVPIDQSKFALVQVGGALLRLMDTCAGGGIMVVSPEWRVAVILYVLKMMAPAAADAISPVAAKHFLIDYLYLCDASHRQSYLEVMVVLTQIIASANEACLTSQGMAAMRAAAQRLASSGVVWPVLTMPNKATGRDLADGFLQVFTSLKLPEAKRAQGAAQVMHMANHSRAQLALLYIYLCDACTRNSMLEVVGIVQHFLDVL